MNDKDTAIEDKPIIINIQPIKAEQASFICPTTKDNAVTLLLERTNQNSFLIECYQCRGMHVVKLDDELQKVKENTDV
jgi:hypothetical protein